MTQFPNSHRRLADPTPPESAIPASAFRPRVRELVDTLNATFGTSIPDTVVEYLTGLGDGAAAVLLSLLEPPLGYAVVSVDSSVEDMPPKVMGYSLDSSLEEARRDQAGRRRIAAAHPEWHKGIRYFVAELRPLPDPPEEDTDE